MFESPKRHHSFHKAISPAALEGIQTLEPALGKVWGELRAAPKDSEGYDDRAALDSGSRLRQSDARNRPESPMRTAFAFLAAAGLFVAPASFGRCDGASAFASAPRSCCKTCRAGKACGDSCIAASKACTKGRGCACNA